MATLQYSTPSLLAVATGLLGSAWASGTIASMSLVGMPTAMSAPNDSVYIWHGIFTRGMNVMPKVAILIAAAYSYVAYDARHRGVNWKGYLAAGGAVLFIIPFTLLFIAGTNATLISASKGATVLSRGRASELIGKWSVLNLGRSLFPLAGAIIGLSTFLGNLS
ncbi:uncharacterized protein J7T54_000655 [Emericellopsis cladophorae]|uniref:Noranthrone monooxygenase n=1 Tax=Emericellopsis cladophorae TaxID=2686198 RepID=A0A9P9Y4P5_9HYPO|nr:uncharacterized protein J7T54_000655 [Emericellopsis cladophorae]KAI6783153.1 hypothetical protein J7T54_000655 [Emericellopsis cladophorae]